MSEKKNIERLFQEKFKDFEAIPEPKVWDNIEDSLKKKRKRRVIPLWWRLSGVAAILLIGFMVGDGIINSTSERTIEIVNENNSEKNNIEKDILPINKEENVANSSSEKNSSGENKFNSEKTSTINSFGKNNSEKNAVAVEETGLNSKKKFSNSVSTSKNNSTSSLSKGSNNNAIANYSATKNKKAKSNPIQKASEITTPNEGIASVYHSNKSNNQKESPENQIEENKASGKETKSINSSQIAFDTSAFEKQKKDSAVVAAVEPNALEELLKEKEKQTVTEAKLNRWQITSNVAPIYFSSASNGSPIDTQFASNEKTYEKNMSYGVGVNYALNEKWSVRGGVNKLTLGYNTNDIVYYPSLDVSARGINQNGYHVAGSSIIVENNTAMNTASFDNIPGKTAGHINQTMGYIEVPLEVSYKLLNQKFGIELVGGMSTMFLNENSLSVVSDGMQASLGKASNLNDVSFTSNIGLGFKYKFWKSFEANVEPKFKYQLNTFTDNAGGFKPYFIGIYSGINFSF